MLEEVDCVVVGAGVVGLAVARACAQAGHETILLEAESAIGTGTSARNSEVIHAGIYYPPGSLKARLCVQGRQALYAYCDARNVPYWRCGKLIVATVDGQRGTLESLAARAAANGVNDLQWLDAGQARQEEPALHCVVALKSPSTGIIDSHALMQALLGDLEAAGGLLALCSPVLSGQAVTGGIVLQVGGGEPMEIRARHVINSAGLQATALAAGIDGLPTASIPSMRLAKGNYYALSAASPFSHLIYPVPVGGGLGVHLTLDLGRRARFGPDVQWIDQIAYDVDPDRAKSFYESIRRYWPGLPDDALHADYAGIRPKVATATGEDADFIIQGPRDHGVDGLVNLYGIESPGLTSALAIADEAVARLHG
ncbi:NAD(P)/FAD-dependent oxidoreductase [Castellaniella sp.]|uniref:NAD(P)/FAD-dependent oxidoreductase n=1 Tax=Castellaniella sp. TaxID=1955812 RepID=UPI003C784A12